MPLPARFGEQYSDLFDNLASGAHEFKYSDAVRAAPHSRNVEALLFGRVTYEGLTRHVDLKLVNRLEFDSGAMAMRYIPRR